MTVGVLVLLSHTTRHRETQENAFPGLCLTGKTFPWNLFSEYHIW